MLCILARLAAVFPGGRGRRVQAREAEFNARALKAWKRLKSVVPVSVHLQGGVSILCAQQASHESWSLGGVSSGADLEPAHNLLWLGFARCVAMHTGACKQLARGFELPYQGWTWGLQHAAGQGCV